MPTMATRVLLLFTILSAASTTVRSHHRHLLHQPFFPVSTPTESPSSASSPSPLPQTHQSQPKYPFSTTPNTPQKPFFPTVSSSPPPPSPAFLSTFPANISSLLFPHRTTPSTHRRLIIAISVSLSLLLAAVLASISAFIVYFRHHHTTDKSSRADSIRLFPPNTVPSDASQKTHHNGNDLCRTPNTSTEFLYLGTLPNPRVTDNGNAANSAVAVGPYQKLGSPELRPLPPLPRHNYSHSFKSGEVASHGGKEGGSDTEEEFFSPRGSSGRKESIHLTPIPSMAPPDALLLQGENSKSTPCRPYLNSCSSSNSVSTSPSPASNVSLGSLKSRSPDSIINFPAPSQAAHVNQTPTERNLTAPIRLPPPPPPPPPPRFWEVPPPVLSGPSRPDVLANEQLKRMNEIVECGSVETTPKPPKLKPLHWDKVKASSERVMVWDQIKSSSFQ